MNGSLTECETIHSLFAQLISAPKVEFTSSPARVKAPRKHGVYIIYDPRGGAAHVGMTIDGRDGLFRRMRDHICDYSSFAKRHLKPKGRSVAQGFAYAWLEVDSPRTRALLEAYATGHLCPAHIGANVQEEKERWWREIERQVDEEELDSMFHQMSVRS